MTRRALYRVARLCWRLGLPGLGLRLAEVAWRRFDLPAEGREAQP